MARSALTLSVPASNALRRIGKTDALYCAISVVLLLIMAVHWHRPHSVIASVDIAPQVDYWWQLRSGFLAWNYSGSPFGAISTGLGVTPYLLVGSALQALMGASWAQITILWLLLSASWLGAYILGRQLRLAPLSALIAAAGYVFNPYQQLQTSVVTFAWMLAILPWAACLVATSLQKREHWRSVVLGTAAITLFGLSVLSITPQLLFETAINLVLLLWCFSAVFRRPKFYWRKFVPAAAGSMLLVSLWWLLPLVLANGGSSVTHPLGPSSNAWIYERSSLLNNLRFSYTWAWHPDYGYFPFTEWYDGNPLTYLAGFSLFAGGVASLIAVRGTAAPMLRRLMIAVLVMMFIAKGLHQPLPGLNESFFRLPLMFLYQEPGGGTALAVLGLSICSGFFIEALLRARAVQVSASAAILVLFASSAAAMVSGAIYHGADRGLPSMYVRIPAYWYDAARYMDRNDADGQTGSVLVLPANKIYEAFYSFGYYGLDAVPSEVFRRPVLTLGASLGYFSDNVGASLANRVQRLLDAHSPLLLPVLRDLNVRYVVIRGDIIAEQQPIDGDASLTHLLHSPARRFGPLAVITVRHGHASILENRYAAGSYSNWGPGAREELSALLGDFPGVDVAAIPEGVRSPAAVNVDVASSEKIRAPAPRRSVWRGISSIGLTGAASRGGNVFSSFSVTPETRPDTTVPLPVETLHRVSPTMLALPRLDHIVTNRDSYNVVIRYADVEYKLIVLNPQPAPVRTSLRVAMAPAFSAQAVLTSEDGVRHEVGVPPGEAPAWVSFRGVYLVPGYNMLRLAVHRAPPATPATAPAPAAIGFREFSLAFGHLRPAAGAKTARSPFFWLGSMPIGVTADTLPRISVSLDGGNLSQAPAGVVLELRSSKAGPSACYAPLEGGQVDLFQAVVGCIRNSGRPADFSDLRATEILDAHVVQIGVPPLLDLEGSGATLKSAELSWKPNIALPSGVGPAVRFTGPFGPPVAAIVQAAPAAGKSVSVKLQVGNVRGIAMLSDGPADETDTSYVTPEQVRLAGRNPTLASHPSVGVVMQRIYGSSQGFAAVLPQAGGLHRLTAATANFSLAAVGPGSQSAAREIMPRRLPLGMETFTLPRDSRLLVTPIRYGAYWSAIYVRGFGHAAIHTEADAWRNAWFVRGGGTLLVFNDVNVVVVFLQLVALGFVGVLFVSLRRKKARNE